MMSKTKTLSNEPKSGGKAGDRAGEGAGIEPSRHLFRLYVAGTTAGATRAIRQVRRVCEEHLHGRYDLEVVDIYQLPLLAKDDQIIATPTLIKVLPAPLRRLIGDLSNVSRVLFGMDIREPC